MKATRKEKVRIGALARQLGVKRFVIRFWEKEFGITASRTKGGQRFYKHTECERFHHIKKLLYEKGFTIAGAKKILEQPTQPLEQPVLVIDVPHIFTKYDALLEIQKKLIALRESL
ncbi:MAG: MerR family transcriptional regulator [Candidatus Babeliales bacterium]